MLRGAELELDRSILDRLADPLVHLLRNAVDHGLEAPAARAQAGKPETGRIEIEARRERDMIQIAVRDDGAGIDLDAVRRRAVEAGLLPHDVAEDLPPDQVAGLIFHAGLSTASSVSEISGRGVGMDAVRATIESLGGTVEVLSTRGRGTTLTLSVPITAAVQRVLLIGSAGETVALPISRVERIVECPAEAIERSGREAFALIDDEPVPVLALAERIALPPPARGGPRDPDPLRRARRARRLRGGAGRRAAGDLREAGARAAGRRARSRGPHHPGRRASRVRARPEPARMTARGAKRPGGRARSACASSRSLGAQRAARVLAEFAGADVQAGPLRTGEALKAPPFETGVIFRVEGELERPPRLSAST